MTDDDLLARIRAAFHDADPVPDGVLASGRSAFSWRTRDAGLAELARDEEARAARSVRGTAARALTFAGPGGLTVEIEVAGRGREITGRLVPATSARVTVRHLGTAPGELTAYADGSGQFALPSVPEGLFSLVFDLPDATSVVTSWVRL